MTTEQTLHYSELSAEYLRRAYRYLSQGDLTQTSEKGWGAAAVAVKAAASKRGINHSTHRQLWMAIQQIAGEAEDAELAALFGSAGELHLNFYEAWLGTEMVTHLLNEVERFVDKLRALD